MARQHQPPADETTSSVAVRRAVPMPSPGEDPGADLGPRTPGPDRGPDSDPGADSDSDRGDPEAPVPIPSSPAPAPRRLFGRRSGSTAPEPEAAEQGQQREPEEQQQQQAAASDGPRPEAAADVVFAGNDDGSDDETASGESPGRPRGPMLAAAAIAGAVLISIPFLVLALGDDEDDRTVKTASMGGTTLNPRMSDDRPAANYVAESPSSSASPRKSKSASPSASAAETKTAPPPVAKETAAAKPTPKPKAKATRAPAPTTRQLVNALSNRANVLVKNVATGMCADLPGWGGGREDGPVNQEVCQRDNTDNMLWDLKVTVSNGGPEGSSLFVIKNREDGLCMDLPAYGSVSPGTKVSEYYCDGTNADNQLWWLDSRPEGYWIRNIASNLCLSVTGGRSAGSDARLHVTQCGDTQQSAQRWMIAQMVKPAT